MSGKIFLISGFTFLLCVFLNLPGVLIHPIPLAIVGLMGPISFISALFTGGYWFIGKITTPKAAPPLQNSFKKESPHELVDFIDQVSNSCVIAVNNVWMQENWCKLTDQKKTEWVLSRFNFLEENLRNCNSDAVSIINAIQLADKHYSRSLSQSA